MSPQVAALIEALRASLLRTMPTTEDLLDAIGTATPGDEFNAAWQRWYYEDGAE